MKILAMTVEMSDGKVATLERTDTGADICIDDEQWTQEEINVAIAVFGRAVFAVEP